MKIEELSARQRELLMQRLLAGAKKPPRPAGIAPVPRDGRPLVCSYTQERLWFLWKLDPRSPAYNMPLQLRLKGALDTDALQRGLREIVRRHEILRTTYELVEGQLMQRVHDDLHVPFAVVDLRRETPQKAEELARVEVTTTVTRPFDLGGEAPVRASVITLADEESLFVIAIHHIAIDGASYAPLWEELHALYAAYSRGAAEASLPVLPIQYADFAAWQRSQLGDRRREELIVYWRGALASAPPKLELPTDRPRPAVKGHQGSAVWFSLSPRTTEGIHALARSEGVTVFMIILAGWTSMLARYAGQDEVVVGTPVANRARPELERLIGCFVNPLPLRCDLRGSPTFREALQRTKTTALDAFERQDLPFEQLVDAVKPPRDPSRSPIYQVMLVVQPAGSRRDFSGLEATFEKSEVEGAQLELMMSVLDRQDRITGFLAYDSDLFDPSTVARMLEHLETLLTAAVAAPETRVADLPLSTASERATLLERSRGAGRYVVDRAMRMAPIGVFGELCTELDDAGIGNGPTGERARWLGDGRLERLAPVRVHAAKRHVVVAATFTAEPVASALEHWLKQLGDEHDVQFAPFGQVFQTLLDPASTISRNTSGVNVLLLRVEDWPEGETSSLVLELVDALKSRAATAKAPFVVVICPSAAPAERPDLAAAERLLISELEGARGVTVSGPDWPGRYGVEDVFDPAADRLGAVPYTPAAFAALATVIARATHALTTPPFKVVAVDADETLWRGVVGEDGVMGIVLDEPRKALQQRLVTLHEAGVQICIVSKNQEADVLEVFERRASEMVLRREHVTALRVSWQPKSASLQSLARELNLGLDSFVFLDDNPIECAEVESACPAVLVLQVPRDGAALERMLEHVWAFDRLRPVTAEDRLRAQHYQKDRGREQLRGETGTLAVFLEKLRLEIDITPLTEADVDRVAQLTQRTNQFNCTTRRRTEPEVRATLDGPVRTLVTRVRDRFGDYGLVGAVMYELRGARLTLDTFLLSCRALGRGVEHTILARLAEIAAGEGATEIEIPFRETARNEPARTFLDSVSGTPARAEGDVRVHVLSLARARAALENARAVQAAPAPSDAGPKVSSPVVPSAARNKALVQASQLQDALALLEAVSAARRRARPGSIEYVAPQTPAERLVADVWAEVLGVAEVGRNDDFFLLGGHSLSAVRMLSRLGAVFGVDLPLRTVFEAPTVALLAAHAQAMTQEAADVSIPRVSREGPIPVSFVQARLWFLDQLDPGNAAFKLPAVLRVEGPLDAVVLERSLQAIVARHETLRTTFVAIDGEPHQVISSSVDLRLARLDAASETEAHDLVKRTLEPPFDLEHGPVIRAALIELAEEDHLFVLCIHHIAADGWSFAIVQRELSAFYTAFSRGDTASPLPALAIGYADYAVWQRAWLDGERLREQLAFWKETLRGAPASLELPTDRARPAVKKYAGDVLRFDVPPPVALAVHECARREGVTVFMVLLAAYAVLLSRWSAQQDLVIGTPIFGRTRPDVEPLIGMFVNTLPLRISLEGEPTFRELLARAKEATLGAYTHQTVPFERIVDAVAPPRDTSRSTIFQAMFVLHNTSPGALTLGAAKLRGEEGSGGASEFDVTLAAWDTPTGLRGRIEYDTALFDRATIARMAEHFEVLLEGAIARPDARVATLPLIGRGEKERLLVELNATAHALSDSRCVHELFEAQAARAPDAIAIQIDDATLTYRQLDERANAVAHQLIARGAGRERIVALVMERSLEMMVAVYATLKAGAAYAPLDPSQPIDRLRFMLGDLQPVAVLSQASVRGAWADGASVTEVDAKSAPVGPVSKPPVTVSGAQLAYVIYTSGSTGKPKAAMNSHVGLTNRLSWTQGEYGLTAADVVLQKTPYTFDVSVWELFWPLVTGARLVLARPDGHKDPTYLAELIAARGVTTTHFVPSMLQAFVEVATGARCKSLRRVLCSGEALPAALVERFHDAFESTELHNLYGPTEAAIDVTHWACVRGDRRDDIPIGRPVWNTKMYVVDPRGELAPIGVPGELCIGGVQVGRGYWLRSALTAEKFVPDCFASQPGARMYRTGDVARWRADGSLQYLGRIDHQVKLRGLRIELGEIESALLACAGVRDVVVTAREDIPGDKRLVAYVVAREGAAVDVDALRATLKTTLPDYMVPSAFVLLAAMPLTSSGKVDRKALPAPDFTRAAEEYVAPRTPTEQVIAEIFMEALQLPRVGVNDDFFAIGGHSLLATRIVGRIHARLAVSVPVRIMFEASTVGQLAEWVDGASGRTSPRPERITSRGATRLSYNQLLWWGRQERRPDSPAFNTVHGSPIKGALDLAVLARSIDEVVRRHEVLRTTFSLKDGEPVQTVAAPCTGVLERVDMAGATLEAVRDVLREHHDRRPQILGAPLARFVLLHLGAEDHVLAIIGHRLVIDPVLCDGLVAEIGTLYDAYLGGLPSPLPESPIQYIDFAAWQRTMVEAPAMRSRIAARRASLAGAAQLSLPFDHPPPDGRGTKTHRAMVPMSSTDWAAIDELARSAKATRFVVLSAVLKAFLSGVTGQTDIGINAPHQLTRSLDGALGSVFGPFTDVFILRTEVSGNLSLRELVRREQTVVVEAQRDADLPSVLVTDDYVEGPLFSVALNTIAAVAGEPVAARKSEALAFSALPPFLHRMVDLAWAVMGANGALFGATDRFEAATVARLATELTAFLGRVLAAPDAPLRG